MFFDQLFWEKKLKESWSHKSDFFLLKNKVIDGDGKSSERAYTEMTYEPKVALR